MDAFDADVLVYAADPLHPGGVRVARLFSDDMEDGSAGIGSVLLLPEVLGKPIRLGLFEVRDRLAGLLSRLDLRALDRATAELATSLAAKYQLRGADAAHLATAAIAGADRFITNNRKDFPPTIEEIAITYPADLPNP